MQTDVWAFGYGFTVALGGVIGFVKAGSIVSLTAGLVFGALALVGAYQTSQDPHNYYLSLAVSGLLAGLMGYRFVKSSKMMPAGLVAILSDQWRHLQHTFIFIPALLCAAEYSVERFHQLLQLHQQQQQQASSDAAAQK